MESFFFLCLLVLRIEVASSLWLLQQKSLREINNDVIKMLVWAMFGNHLSKNNWKHFLNIQIMNIFFSANKKNLNSNNKKKSKKNIKKKGS